MKGKSYTKEQTEALKNVCNLNYDKQIAIIEEMSKKTGKTKSAIKQKIDRLKKTKEVLKTEKPVKSEKINFKVVSALSTIVVDGISIQIPGNNIKISKNEDEIKLSW